MGTHLGIQLAIHLGTAEPFVLVVEMEMETETGPEPEMGTVMGVEERTVCTCTVVDLPRGHKVKVGRK